MSRDPIKHRLVRDGTLPSGEPAFNFGVHALTRGEAMEFLITLRRLELYRLAEIDTDIVERAMKTMASFSTRIPDDER